MKNKLALIVAVVLGLIAMYGFLNYWSAREKKYKEEFKTVNVVAAAQRIKAGTDMRPGMMSLTAIPASAVTPDHVVEGDETRLLGQTIIRSVERGEPLLNSYFRRPVEKLRDRLAHGERALTLRVDSITGVGGNLVPGSRVDMIGTFPAGPVPGSAARAAPGPAVNASDQSMALLSNVTVLAVDTRTRETEYLAATGGARGQSYATVTLAVTPEEAVLLVFAQQYGSLTLALRPDADTTLSDVNTSVDQSNLRAAAERAQQKRTERLEKRSGPLEVMPNTP